MNPQIIEVFVEPGCKTCNKVVSLVHSFAQKRRLEMRVFDRERDSQVFLERNVVVCPATYIDSQLAFYGEFTEEALVKLIRT